jgi:hypothetical protein
MPRSRRSDDFDDDDFDAPRPRRRPQSSGGTGVKIVAIIFGFFLVIVLMCGGLIYYMVYSARKTVDRMQDDVQKMAQEHQAKEANSDKGRAQRAADAFIQELKGRRIDAAYRMTSSTYQKQTTLNEFRALVTQSGDVLQRAMPFLPDVFAPDTGPTYVFTQKLAVPRGFSDISVTVTKEGAEWKVDQFRVDRDRGP